MSRKKMTDANSSESPVESLPKRLCSEIQLFDLCELERCRFRDERFCTDPEMIARFEAVAEPVERPVDSSHEEDDDIFEEHDCDDEFDDDEGNDRYSVFDDEDKMERPDSSDD